MEGNSILSLISYASINETNCNPDKLPFGINELVIPGFHPPIVQASARAGGKGGGLITYIGVYKRACL